MKKMMTLLLAVAMILALSACNGGTQPQTTQAPTETKAAETKPVETTPPAPVEQTLKLGMLSSGANNKIESPWQNQSLQSMLMFRSLFYAETDLTTLSSDLADSNYQVSDDGLVYTIKMLDGNVWSDGEPVTADDFAFSVKMNLKAAVSNGIYTSAFNKIEGAAAWKEGTADDLSGLAVDGNTITITLTAPHKAMPAVLAQFVILPEHVLAEADPLELHNNVEFWSKPVVNGPFMITEFNAGNYFVMEHNPKYNGQVPKITKIVTSVISDFITGAQSGQVDYFNTNSMDIINEVSKVSGMTMYPVDILFYRYFICNMKGVDGNENPVMQNPLVREAILYAIDRETLAESLFPGLATTINSGVADDAAAFNGKKYEYNPEKAKQLLQEAGYDFNHTFRILYYYSDQGSIDFMQAIAYYLGEIGMKVEVTQSTQGTQDLFQTRNYDVGYKGLSAFDISEWYGEYSSSNANFRNIFGGDTAFDELNARLAASTNADTTNAILKEMADLENELLYKLPLFTIGNNVFINENHVKVNDGQVFGNPWYRTNIGFANWEIVG